LLLIAEGIQKPGNMGAILRTTDAVGTDAVVFVNPGTDLYNPNVLRASLGTFFTQKIIVTGREGLLELKQKNPSVRFYGATLQNKNIYWEENFRTASAICVGAEDQGLTEDFRKLLDKQIYIPMNGTADSLNVSVSAAVLLYEALRQRRPE
jgi:TrmH family RNA methyltransferase